MQKKDRFYLSHTIFSTRSSSLENEMMGNAFRAQESEEQLLPLLFDVPAEGRGEFMTTAQISERLVTYGNIKKPMPLNRLGVLLGTKM